MGRAYQICQRCIMDTSDPEIRFDANGVCNHCTEFFEHLASSADAETRRLHLEHAVRGMRAHGRGRPFDCVIGVSGGADSSYTVYLARSLGLRPLAVHMDNGWDSELAVNNVERLLKHLDVELATHVLDWEEFKDLQRAMLRASVPDVEIPTDHAILAVMYQTAARYRVPIVTGTNFITEGILPARWTFGIGDWKYIKGIHDRYGSSPLKKFPHFTRNRLLYYSFVVGVQLFPILDYVDYSREAAIDLLTTEFGWRSYGGKHHESLFTKFLQGYILPRKFGIDKRRAHLSTLICADQTTRDQAMEVMNTPPYSEHEAQQDLQYVIKKLDLAPGEFDAIMSEPPKNYSQYPSYLDSSMSDAFRKAFLSSSRLIHRRVRTWRRSVIPEPSR